ncbi:hypothetical protein [Hydrotalea sp.]|uniref:hypothetical protein n=1 Tax=Hydrotalea sp. TaxID=2881279 RepID=UPI0026370D7F|nr:hypothetical protein [Hydrotalea sp.]
MANISGSVLKALFADNPAARNDHWFYLAVAAFLLTMGLCVLQPDSSAITQTMSIVILKFMQGIFCKNEMI